MESFGFFLTIGDTTPLCYITTDLTVKSLNIFKIQATSTVS